MDADFRRFVVERFDAVERRLDQIEEQLRSGAQHRCPPCGHCESCRHGACCARRRHRHCCGKCREHDGRDCRCAGGAGGALRALGEAQAVLAAFDRARDDKQWRELEEIRESLRVLSRRVSALERRQCCGGA